MINEVSKQSDIKLHIISYAPGKVIISGEHSVVYGKPALSVSIDKYTMFEIKVFDNNNISDNSFFVSVAFKDTNEKIAISKQMFMEHYTQNKAENNNLIKTILLIMNEMSYFNKETIERFIKQYSFICELSSQIPIGFGLGSSAALNASIVNGFTYTICKLINQDYLSKKVIARIANQAEKVYHTNPSGIDVSTSVNGGLVFFNNFNDYYTINNIDFFSKNDIQIYLISTNKKRDCKTFTGKVSQLKEDNIKLFEESIQSIGNITQSIIQLVKQKEPIQIEEFFTLIKENQRLLQTINVSTDEIDNIINILLKNNFYGKITGAGGGGFIVAFIHSSTVSKFKELSEENNFNVLGVNFDTKGSFIKEIQ